MPREGQKFTPEQRAYISERTRASLARRRAAKQIAPSELAQVERSGTVSRALRPYAAQAAEETACIAEALGGIEALSEQRQVLVQDLGRLGLVLRVMVARFLEGDGDADLGSKISTLVGQRRAQLAQLGLEHHEKELDLQTYLAQHAERTAEAASSAPHAANGEDPDPQAGAAEIVAQEGEK